MRKQTKKKTKRETAAEAERATLAKMALQAFSLDVREVHFRPSQNCGVVLYGNPESAADLAADLATVLGRKPALEKRTDKKGGVTYSLFLPAERKPRAKRKASKAA